MSDHQLQLNFREPVLWFAIGWSLILLVPILSVLPSLQTFMHPWRAEFAASVLLLITLGFLAYRSRDKIQGLCFPRSEIYFIVLPLATFIAWSGLSIFWSPSWKSALYHTLVWAEYLIFYVIVRQILEKKDGFKTLAVPLTIMLLIIALPPVFEYLSFLVFGGATSLGMRYAKYGELFNTVCPLIAVAALRLDGKRFFFALLAILTMWLFIISTLSRTNLVVFVFGLAAISLAIFVFRRFHKYRLKIALLLLGVVLVPVLSHTITFF